MQQTTDGPAPKRLTPRKLAYAGGAVALLLVAGIAVGPSLIRGPLTERLQSALDDQVGATVRFEEVQLSWFWTFPHLGLTVHELSITNHAPFEGQQLAQVESLHAVVDVRSVFADTLDIRKVGLLRPTVNVRVDPEGRWNTELFPSEDEPSADDTEESSFSLSLQSYSVEGLQLTFEDAQANRYAHVEGLNHRGSGDLTAQQVHLDTHTEVGSLTVRDGAVTLLNDARIDWALDVEQQQDSGLVTLRENRLLLNALALQATGTVQPDPEGWELALALDAPGASFKELLSLIPSAWIDGFEGVSADGTVGLGGTVEGLWASDGSVWPALDLKLAVEDGRFRYPDLPAGIDAVNLQAQVLHPGGPWENLAIELPHFAMRVDNQPIQGRLSIKELGGDPQVDAQIEGKVDLGVLASALPSEGRRVAGRVELDVDLGGRLSDFENQRVEAVRATGTVLAEDVVLEDPALGSPWYLDRLDATLDPRWVQVDSLKVRASGSDVEGELRLDNLLSWLLKGDTLVGRGTMTSGRLDLDALYPDDTGTESEPAESTELYAVPADLDLRVALQMDHLTYGGRDYREIQGDVHAVEGSLRLENLRMKLLDGQMILDGSYRALSPELAELSVTVDLADLGLAGLVESFETLRRLVPIAQRAPGRLNSQVSLQLRLGPDLMPDLGSLVSHGKIELFGVTLRPEILQGVQQTLKAGKVDAIQLGESMLAYDLRDGRMGIEPTPIKLGPLSGVLRGDSGVLDRSLDFRIDLDVPVGQVASGLVRGLTGDSTVDVGLQIGGTYERPTLRADVGDLADQAKDRVVQEVTDRVDQAVEQVSQRVAEGLERGLEEAQQQVDALLAQAQTQADRLVAEANTRAQQLRDVAAQQGDRLIEEAQGQPLKLVAAREAARKLNVEADKAAERVESEAQRAADAVMDRARGQADTILAEARDRTEGAARRRD